MNEKWKTKLRETFENHEITPSENLWNTIENRLEEMEKPQNSRERIWLVAASGIVAILGVSYFLKNSSFQEKLPKSEIVLNTDLQPISTKENSSKEIEIQKISENKLEEKITKQEISSEKNNKNSLKILSEEILKINENQEDKTENLVAETPKTEINSEKKILSPQEKLLQEIELEIRVEKLLAEIESEIKDDAQREKFNASARKLLSEVESENFKTRINLFFKKLEAEIDKTQLAIQEKIKALKILYLKINKNETTNFNICIALLCGNTSSKFFSRTRKNRSAEKTSIGYDASVELSKF